MSDRIDESVRRSPTAGPTSVAPAGDQDRTLVVLLKLASAADRVVAGVRSTPLTDRERALVDELDGTVKESWQILGTHRRMSAGRGGAEEAGVNHGA